MKRNKADREGPRGTYDLTANQGKLAFIDALRSWMKVSGTNQRALAGLVGYSTAAVSDFLGDPLRLPESFIRACAVAIPELSDEYVRFRLTADAPFFNSAIDKRLAGGTIGKLKDRAAVLEAVERMSKSVTLAIDELKKSV